jgi:hypothetical protein
MRQILEVIISSIVPLILLQNEKLGGCVVCIENTNKCTQHQLVRLRQTMAQAKGGSLAAKMSLPKWSACRFAG